MLFVAFLLSLLGVVFWLVGLYLVAMIFAGFSMGMVTTFLWLRKFPAQ